ncbi:hypothetical protein AAZX31_01G000200 [Glycine max]
MKGYIILGEHRGKGNWGHTSNNPDSESMGPVVQVKSTPKEKQKKQERDDGMNNGFEQFLLVLVVQATSLELSLLSIALQMEGCGGKSRFCATYFEVFTNNKK